MTNEKSKCLNCDAEALRAFCPECGQKQNEPLVSVGHWIGEALDELFSLDGKLLRSLKQLILKPGTLSLFWARGRRTYYVRPLRLYMFCAFLYFFLLPFQDHSDNALAEFIHGFDQAGPDEHEIGSSFDTIITLLPAIVAVIMVPLFAGMVGIFARKREGHFTLWHLVFSLHFHSVAFLAFVVTNLAPSSISDVVDLTVLIGLVTYLVIALKSTYKISLIRSLIGGAFILLGYLVFYMLIIISIAFAVKAIGINAF
jgi:hypothetical protein